MVMKIEEKMEPGIQIHQWGFYRYSDNMLIATCVATTYYEAVSYFEEVGLVVDSIHIVKIVRGT
jgi:hypothetical protein